jgi:threonylcarbamoyladenosine tRNA methylthiotransferase MtaB
VVEEVQKLCAKEVVLNGINLSAYDYKGIKLSGLLEKLKDTEKRVRLGSLEVGVITDEFLIVAKAMKNFAPHFHLSLQSGANAVLKKMNRRYTREEYLEKVELIRKYFPDAGITTDIIVGFPSESEQDFLDTIDLVERVKFSDIHAFPFSPRSGTVAYKMQDLSGDIKKERLNRLLEIKEKSKLDFAKKMVGKSLDFLFEEVKNGYAEGYSENYLRLYVKDFENTDKITKVKVIEPFKDGAIAQIIKE